MRGLCDSKGSSEKYLFKGLCNSHVLGITWNQATSEEERCYRKTCNQWLFTEKAFWAFAQVESEVSNPCQFFKESEVHLHCDPELIEDWTS